MYASMKRWLVSIRVMLLVAILLMLGNRRSTFGEVSGLYIGRSILGYAITSLKSILIWPMIHDGSEIEVSPRRRMVTFGFSAVTIVALAAVRFSATGGGICA